MDEGMVLPDIGTDLISPRFSFLTNRKWMTAYHSLEAFEINARDAAQSRHSNAMLMWLKCITLFHSAYSETFDWSDKDDFKVEEMSLRMDLLGLAGTTSKPTLDALLGGYYSPAYGQIRNLLETWRREVFIRLSPSVAIPYFHLRNDSPIGADGLPKKDRNTGIPFSLIAQTFETLASEVERELFDAVNAGIVHMHAGAHPSAEGIQQLFNSNNPGRRNYGPTYDHALAAFGFKWGLMAQIFLLAEVELLGNRSASWTDALAQLHDQFTIWVTSPEAQFDDPFQDD
jgi:hypothetical protein